MIKKFLAIIFLCAFAIALILYFITYSEKIRENQFDKNSGQKPVYSHDKIDSILAIFPQVGFTELKQEYQNYTDPDNKFEKTLKKKVYRIVKGDQVFIYLVGKHRIKDFLSKDKYYEQNLKYLKSNYEQYWLIDPKVIHWTLDLMNVLSEKGFDRDAFTITKGHRHPLYNKKIGGASKSRHIQGQAVDITIQDINKDGKINYHDKQIVLDILNDEIVKEQGGIGRYPNSLSIHYDTRGYKARWDSY